MTLAGTIFAPASALQQSCFLTYINTLRQMPYEQMDGSPFSQMHIDEHVSRELDRMDIPLLTPRLLSACYFVDRIMQCEGRLYDALKVDEPSRNQLLSGALRVRAHFNRPRYSWMEEDPILAGAILMELETLQRLRLTAYKTVMDWKSDVQRIALDTEDFVHPRDLDGLLPALTGLQTFFVGMLGKAQATNILQPNTVETYFFPSGRPDSGNLAILPNGELGTFEAVDESPTDPAEALYVTPTTPSVTTMPLDEEATPTMPLPLVIAKQEQVRSETPPLPLVTLRAR